MSYNIIEIAIVAIILFILLSFLFWIIIRKLKLWYWKIDTIVKNQEEQLDLMDSMLFEMRVQNQRLRNILTEWEEQEEPQEEENNESTPQ